MSKEENRCFDQETSYQKIEFVHINSGGNSATASESTYHENYRTVSFDSGNSVPSKIQSEAIEEFSSGRSELLSETASGPSENSTISATQTPSLPTEHGFPSVGDREASVGSSTEFGPCSQKAFNSAGILLAAQQQLSINRKSREEELHHQLRSEEQHKKEKRLQLEQTLRAEAQVKEQERLTEHKRRQQLEQQKQDRINEERLRIQEEERRQQQTFDQEKRLEEDRQRREFLKRQDIERNRKKAEEAEIRKQKAIEDQLRRRKEEKTRLERQCEFPASARIEPINMPSAAIKSAQHPRSDARGASTNQQLYLKRQQQQHQRSGTMSSNGETPMKFKSTRNNYHANASEDYTNAPGTSTPTLFFERNFIGEVAEIKSYTEIIQNQNRDIIELKSNNNEMELRLQDQTKDRIDLESTIEDQEIHWNKKCDELEQTVDSYMKSLEAEKTKNKKLWHLVYAKEKEIQRAYQRRFEGSQQANRRGPNQRNSPVDRSSTNQRGPTEQRATVALNRHRSPHDYLEASGSNQNIQERNALKLLEGFLGF